MPAGAAPDGGVVFSIVGSNTIRAGIESGGTDLGKLAGVGAGADGHVLYANPATRAAAAAESPQIRVADRLEFRCPPEWRFVFIARTPFCLERTLSRYHRLGRLLLPWQAPAGWRGKRQKATRRRQYPKGEIPPWI
jgi:hypothetical protein